MVRTTTSMLVFIILSSSVVARAITRGQFVGPYGIIRVLSQDATGVTDSDGQILYDAMDVPVKNSMIGPGKAIQTTDKGMQFICANRQNAGYECSIFVHNTPQSIVDPVNHVMSYKLTGEKANAYVKLFKVNSQEEFSFISADRTLKVQAKKNYFEVRFAESGVRLGSLYQDEKPVVVKTLVIANVEDTLKLSHARNFWDSLNYVNSTRKRYLGMSDALNLLEKNNPEFHFIYLTQSPQLVAGKNEREFLNRNDFPKGSQVTYDSNQDVDARLVVLNDVISKTKPKRVILLSHNGSPDVEVFHRLIPQFPNIAFHSYLHIIYSASAISEVGNVLTPEQTGYVTSVELLAEWQQKGFIDFKGAKTTMMVLRDRILAENVEAAGISEFGIPSFVNCDDFQWRWSVTGEYDFLAPMRDHLINRCHNMQTP